MDQVMSNHLARAGRMKSFFTLNQAFIAPYTDITEEINEFYAMLSQFDEHAAEQQRPITAYAVEKREALKTAARLTSKWGVRCHQKAVKAGLMQVAETLDRSLNAIERQPDLQGLAMMKGIYNDLNEHVALFAQQGLTPVIISDINNAIMAYEGLMNAPKAAIDARKADTELMENMMKKIKEKLAIIVSLLQAAWEPEEHCLAVEMMNNYRINGLGHHYTGIRGSVAHANHEPLKGYRVVCQTARKEAETELTGNYRIRSMKSGLYEFKLLNPAGTVVKTALIPIKRGRTVMYDWVV